MNSFQSLLNSYTKLRKRTYQVTSINETGDPQGKVFSADKPGVSEVREKLRSIAAFGDKAKIAILKNIGAANSLNKQEIGAVWIDEKDPKILRVKGSFGTADFHINDKQMIIDILSTEEGKEETGMQTDAMGQAIDPGIHPETRELYVPDPIDTETAQNNLEAAGNIQSAINILRPDMREDEEFYNWNRTNSAFTVPTPDNPFYEAKTTLQLAIKAFYTDRGLPIPKEALKEASKDIKRLSKFLADNAQDVADGKCLQNSDDLEALRSMFFFRNNALCYGNLNGESVKTPKIVEEFTGKVADESLIEDIQKNEPLDKKNRPKKPFLQGTQALTDDPSPCVAITSQVKNTGSAPNALIDTVRMFNEAGICGPDGKKDPELEMFNTDSTETPTSLIGEISETSPYLNYMYMLKQEAEAASDKEKYPDPSKDPKVAKIERQIAEEMHRLVDYACSKTEELDKLIKLKMQAEKVTGEDTPHVPYMLQQAQDAFELHGTSDPNFNCGDKDKVVQTIAQMIALDYTGNGVSPRLRALREREGVDYEIVKMVNGKPINATVGANPGGEGVANTDNTTVVKADYCIRVKTKEEVLKIFEEFDIDPSLPDAKLTLTQHEDGYYYIEVSDKLYNSSTTTSNGVLDIEVSLGLAKKDPKTGEVIDDPHRNDPFDSHLASISDGDPKLEAGAREFRETYKEDYLGGLAQVTGDESEAKANADDSKLGRSALDEKVKVARGKFGAKNKKGIKLVGELDLALQEYDRDHADNFKNGTPKQRAAALKQAKLIAHLSAGVDAELRRADMKPEDARKDLIFEAILHSTGTMSSAVCLTNSKHNGKQSESCSNQDRRRLIRDAYYNKEIEVSSSGKTVKFSYKGEPLFDSGTRVRTGGYTSTGSQDTGAIRRILNKLGIFKPK